MEYKGKEEKESVMDKHYKIAIAGTGYVGLSIAVLLSQYNLNFANMLH